MLRLYPKEPLILVDLRKEFHGFSHDIPIERLNESGEYKEHCFQYNMGLSKDLLLEADCMSEKTLIESLEANIQYIRIPITDHHYLSDTQVDFFIDWVKNLPPSTWIHFHCAGGRGRTAVLLCMLDMMQNASHMSTNEFMNKQTELGGSTLYRPKEKHASTPQEEKRYEFLSLFHKYCLEAQSSWLHNQKTEKPKDPLETPLPPRSRRNRSAKTSTPQS